MAIVNAQLMAEVATEFNVGVDILSHGNRTIEKELGSERMSGDTVNVTIMDSGKVFRNTLDLTPMKGKMGVNRGSVPVRVRPLGIAAEVSEGELELAIQQPKIMAKRVANLQDEVNRAAYRGIIGSSQPYVVPDTTGMTTDSIDRAFRKTCFDAEAHVQTSKVSGNLFGLSHPQTWNRMNVSLQANFGANPKRGDDLYKNQLGDFMGVPFTKGVDTLRFTAIDMATAVPSFSVGVDGELTVGISDIDGYTGETDGEIFPMPVLLSDYGTDGSDGAPVQCVDALGKPTGIQKAVFFKWVVTSWDPTTWQPLSGEWQLAQPIFLAGPRKNAHSKLYEATVAASTLNGDTHGWINPDYDWYAKQEWNRINAAGYTPDAAHELTFYTANMLVVDTTYLAPMTMFHEDDFLIGIKGIKKMTGADSFTIPTEFSDKGIIPWRGTVWTDPYMSLSLFRVDAAMGFSMYQGVSGASIFIPDV